MSSSEVSIVLNFLTQLLPPLTLDKKPREGRGSAGGPSETPIQLLNLRLKFGVRFFGRKNVAR